MSGFDIRLPRRIVVDEVITTGTGQKTGYTGWTGQGAASRYNSWSTPLPPSTSAYVMAVQNASTSTTTAVTTFTSSAGAAALNSPDYPRAVRVVPGLALGPANSSAAFVSVTGTDQFGNVQTDKIFVSGAGPIDGLIAFKTITSVVLPACSSPATPFTIGLSNTFGLDRTPASVAAAITGGVNGTAETTRPIIGAPSTSANTFPAAGIAVASRATAKFSTSATSSAGALTEIFFHAQDTTHI